MAPANARARDSRTKVRLLSVVEAVVTPNDMSPCVFVCVGHRCDIDDVEDCLCANGIIILVVA